ncbi:LLM class flavin-dependent oxidoreductase [Aquibium sp. A9E412]|uniref:LLM class flavin-dependent oxidoreductase n=1 Tax=Aquibium sp. A9E412 TaxID=2976767 RepID=UPI0025B2371B|nr:LLM class flavin-dependent oxidoreductase [Aquibium sp. A9E412]MDN2567127.1 LLM class flavin-dependent oxidoreductase [Aquibium sp. A9E412]
MDFSFCALPRQTSAEVIEMVQRAEQAGMPMVWVPDETFMRDPYVLLGAIAATTSRIRLGVGIANPYTRHPIQIARAVATVADLAAGRVVLGIGAGLKPTRKAMGAPDGDFTETTRDAILAMKAVLAGERHTVANDVFRFDDAHMEFRPKNPVDIYVATTHPRAFRMAGEVADGVIVGNVGRPEGLAAVTGWIREAAAGAGRAPDAVKIVAWNFALCGDDKALLYDTIRLITARTIANSHSKVTGMLGIDKAQVDTIRAVMRGGTAAVDRDLIPDDYIDRLAVVGSVEECRARIESLGAAGADIFGMRPSLEVLERLDYEGMAHQLLAALR